MIIIKIKIIQNVKKNNGNTNNNNCIAIGYNNSYNNDS